MNIESQIAELQFVVTHLQKTVDDLNSAVLLQQKQIDSLARQLGQAKAAVESILHAENSPRSLLDDKPPHY